LSAFAYALAIDDPSAGKHQVKLGHQEGFIEGDLELPMDRNALNKTSTKKWPDAIVYYLWDTTSKWTQAHYDMMNKAMRMIEKHTCVKFVERTKNEPNFVFIINGAACSSNSVGMAGGYQHIQLRDDPDTPELDYCWYTIDTVMHELLHAIGLAHEHTRPDRDQYIKVHPENYGYGNITAYQFQIASNSETYGVEYNYKSVMHYDAYSAGNGQPTMTPLKAGVTIDDLGAGMIWNYEGDWEKVRQIYQCKGTYPMEPCVDTYNACDLYKNNCENAEWLWLKKQCAVTCGKCPKGVPIGSNEPCEDKITYCYQYASDCGKPGKEWLNTSCRKTCNLCSPATPNPGCKDEYANCSDYKPLPCTANHYSYTLCKKSCGLC
jgi:hypothetical protein